MHGAPEGGVLLLLACARPEFEEIVGWYRAREKQLQCAFVALVSSARHDGCLVNIVSRGLCVVLGI